MLGRLIQGYTRGGQLESATDETHTRNLLWPEFQPDGRPGSLSPPTTPFGSPAVRVSPFDDRVGLELNETKDVRLIIAQDAFGTNDRPLLLFDTQAAESKASSSPESTPFLKSEVSPPAMGPTHRQIPGIPIMGHMRNRSSTISGASASWARPNKESEPTDHLTNVLDCMFGVSSAAKSGSSTKMHLLPGDRSAASDLSPRSPSMNTANTAPARAPLVRARTATNTVNTIRQHPVPKEVESEPRDAILVTRMFSVNLPEAQDNLRQHRSSSAGQADSVSPVSQGPEQQGGQGKKPKLVEKKTPVYAVGLLFYLPRAGDVRPSTSAARPSSRASYNTSSTPNSYGSDSFSSWTFLNAIPEHLVSPQASGHLTDKGIEIIVRNWDVVLRCIAAIETIARAELAELLQQVYLALVSSAAKAPKGPSEQRTNQRNIYLRSPNVLTQVAELQRIAKHTLWRVSYALRIPRVLTGFGLDNGGHWLDEARYLVRICGNKQQNFFLFNLLTAFLGNHTEWLERLGPDWYRKQFKALNRGKSRSSNLASRTVIICENRSMARRLIFLLASFLPRSHGANALAKLGTEFMSPLLTPDASSSSPGGRVINAGSIRRHAHGRSREGPIMFHRRDVSGLSTSVSSGDSVGGIAKAIRSSSRSVLSRSELEPGSSRQPPMFSPAEGTSHLHKTNATSSTATPNMGTPVPHFSTKTDSYFPEGAVVDGEESGASADLARILRRDSTSNPQSSQPSINWGSLINNVSGLWNKKQDSSSSIYESTTTSVAGSLRDRRRLAPRSVPIHGRRPSHLETMVDEATDLPKDVMVGPYQDSVTTRRQPIAPSEVEPPRLTVDDKDGVVDVDINIPGFIGWSDGSPPPSSLHRPSPSFASTDDVESSSSFRSHRTESVGSPANVAGYLKRYHEDFILQGLKSYAELQDEVKQSMSREPTPVDDMCHPLSGGQANGDRWVNVCTTLLADTRSFSIHRLTLQRRAGNDVTIEGPAISHPVPKSAIASSVSGALRHQKQSLTEDPGEQFTSETVMDFDITLTDAIERVLNETEQSRLKSVTPTRTHSRTVSTGTTSSAKSEPLEISSSGKGRDWTRPPTLSQSDCRHAVVGALEQVVKSVNDDLAKHHRGRDDDGHIKIDGNALNQEMKQDNVLREGVKKWLLNVETRSVW